MLQEKLQYQKYNLTFCSTLSLYEDDIWILDKLKYNGGMTGNKVRLSFKQIPNKYILNTKNYIYNELLLGKSLATLKRYIQGLSLFFKWIIKHGYNYLHMSILQEYTNYLNSLEISIGTKEIRWESVQLYLGKTEPNPFKRTSKHRNLSIKYIPKDKLNKLDNLFKTNTLPLYIRTVYWLLRLIPSRIGEITTLPIDCFEETTDMYILRLHMFKQNGGYANPQVRSVFLLKDRVSNFLFSLIKKQQLQSKKLQQYLKDEDKGCLFTYIQTYFINNEYVEQKAHPKFISVLNEDSVASFFRKLAKRYGQDYKITTHQLRHNAIADRLLFGFTPKQIQTMTAHTTTNMIITSYSYYDTNTTIELSKSLNKTEEAFTGKIIDDRLERILLNKPNSKEIPNIGICSNYTNCKRRQ